MGIWDESEYTNEHEIPCDKAEGITTDDPAFVPRSILDSENQTKQQLTFATSSVRLSIGKSLKSLQKVLERRIHSISMCLQANRKESVSIYLTGHKVPQSQAR